MESNNDTFLVKCSNNKLINFNYDESILYYVEFKQVCSNSTLPSEIAFVGYKLTSRTELVNYQNFAWIKTRGGEPRIIDKEVEEIKYPINDSYFLRGHKTIVKFIFDNIERHNHNDSNKFIVFKNENDIKTFQNMLYFVKQDKPSYVHFTVLDYLTFGLYNFMKVKCPVESFSQLKERNHYNNFPPCEYHANYKNSVCITSSIRKSAYIIHDILKQNNYPVSEDYLTTSPRKRNSINGFRLKPHKDCDFSNLLDDDRASYFISNFPNLYIHFVEFEFAYQFQRSGYNNQPVEVSVTSCNIIENIELDYYHSFINPGPFNDNMKYEIARHQIDPRNPNISFLDSESVKNDLNEYFNQFEGIKYVCIHSKFLKNDYPAFEKVIGSIPSDICVITHYELHGMVLAKYNIYKSFEYLDYSLILKQVVQSKNVYFMKTLKNTLIVH